MLKVRLQGTKRDINWYKKVLLKNNQIRIIQISKLFANKGTDKYYRVYVELEENE